LKRLYIVIFTVKKELLALTYLACSQDEAIGKGKAYLSREYPNLKFTTAFPIADEHIIQAYNQQQLT
jgi:hypothetical protein